MKRIITIAAALLMTLSVWAQSPEKMSYQAVIRDAGNALVATQAVGMQISILQGGAAGTPVYVETQTPTSNANGLVSLEIGTGTLVSGDFTTIDWANDTYFIKTETDPTGGSTYTITGTSQLMSVPYALYAKTSGSSTPGPQGPVGATGATGAASTVAGPVGATGATGAASTIAGPVGATGATGAASTIAGPVGATGAAGSNGTIGATGPAGPAGGNITVVTISANTTLNTTSMFILAIGTITIKLPSSPATGQVLYFFSDTPSSITINPNGKFFRQGAVDYGNSTITDFGGNGGQALSLIFNGSKWNALSIK